MAQSIQLTQRLAAPSFVRTLRALWQMTKPTIGLLVVVTTLPALVMAKGSAPSAGLVLITILGTFLASASAAVFNHIVDHDLDAVMLRTRARPLPAGHVPKSLALSFACLLAIGSFALLYRFTYPLAAWIAVIANAFYVLLYTSYLKRRTVQNIVIGGAAGAVGPLMGWAAATGSIGWEAWVLFLIIFLWTPPHFWALAIKYRDDYAAAKIPMLPAVHGFETTRRQIFYYTLLLVPAVASLSIFGAAGLAYTLVAGAATGYFVWITWKLFRSQTNDLAMPVFHFSCFYLFLVFGILAIDRLWLYA